MKRRIPFVAICLVGILCTTPIFDMKVYSAPSIEHDGMVDQEQIYVENELQDPNQVGCYFFDDFEEKHVENHIIETIDTINDNKHLLDELIDITHNHTDFELGDYKLLTDIRNLSIYDKINGEIIPNQKNITVTWEVPLISDKTEHIKILHYSTHRGVWEILEPIEVNYEDRTITQNFQDLSPMAVLYIPSDNANSDDVESSSQEQNEEISSSSQVSNENKHPNGSDETTTSSIISSKENSSSTEQENLKGQNDSITKEEESSSEEDKSANATDTGDTYTIFSIVTLCLLSFIVLVGCIISRKVSIYRKK